MTTKKIKVTHPGYPKTADCLGYCNGKMKSLYPGHRICDGCKHKQNYASKSTALQEKTCVHALESIG